MKAHNCLQLTSSYILLTWYSASSAARRSRADSPAGSSMALSLTGAGSGAAAAFGAGPSFTAPSGRLLDLRLFLLGHHGCRLLRLVLQ